MPAETLRMLCSILTSRMPLRRLRISQQPPRGAQTRQAAPPLPQQLDQAAQPYTAASWTASWSRLISLPKLVALPTQASCSVWSPSCHTRPLPVLEQIGRHRRKMHAALSAHVLPGIDLCTVTWKLTCIQEAEPYCARFKMAMVMVMQPLLGHVTGGKRA